MRRSNPTWWPWLLVLLIATGCTASAEMTAPEEPASTSEPTANASTPEPIETDPTPVASEPETLNVEMLDGLTTDLTPVERACFKEQVHSALAAPS